MLPLRDDFIDFTFALFKYRNPVDLDQIRDFFEKLLAFGFRPEQVQSWTEVDWDNFKFFNYELMLNFVTILLQMRKYEEVGFFVQGQYFYRNSTNDLKQVGIEMFNRPVRSLDEFRNNRLGLQRVNLTADLIKARATRKDVSFGNIRETDLILHYVTALVGGRFGWFPRTSAYGGRGSAIEMFDRLVSRRHFERVKVVFGVDTVDELKTAINASVLRNSESSYGNSPDIIWNYDIRPVEQVIDPQKIALDP